MELSERDGRVLCWVGEQRGVRRDLLGWLLWRWSPVEGYGGPVSRRAVFRWLERMESRGLVRRHQLAGECWVELTAAGARHAQVGENRYGIPVSRVAHRHAVGVVRLWLEWTRPGGVWLPEGIFFRAGLGEGSGHRPDGGWVEGGKVLAVEVELSRKASFRDGYREIMERMPADVDGVWWFAPAGDVEWLERRLAGSPLPFEVAGLPTLDAATHPEGCRCPICRVVQDAAEDAAAAHAVRSGEVAGWHVTPVQVRMPGVGS